MENNPISNHAKLNPDSNWWRGAVIYQIYPRSFHDSNEDGIGDIRGITQRLPYLASLGIDAVWISPFFKSPMLDFGYDVSDYCDVDPMFGELADFDQLLEAAHQQGIRIIIDLVLSHSSEQHRWFKESRRDRHNPKSDWYVWAEPKDDGTPPNNWLSIFGGSAWQWDGRREQYYLHNFLTSQPDLNFHNPEVQTALLAVVKFWLDRGVDGFRLDTINFYVHDQQLRSNPALPKEQRDDSIAPSVNPYNHQLHIYSKNRPENLQFLEKFRALLDQYPGSTAVGEVGDAQRGLEIMGEYTRGDKRIHMCYSFEFLSNNKLSAARVVEVLDAVDQKAREGWPCWAFSNHDVVRHATRWQASDAQLRLLCLLLVCLKGSICIYQGEELGFSEAEINFEDLHDPYGIEFWPEFKGRDGCRTPMAWNNHNDAGFSTATPWLPISQAHRSNAVSVQDFDPNSLLNHYRKALRLRQNHPSLRTASHNDIQEHNGVLSFNRIDDDNHIHCVFNLSDCEHDHTLPAGKWQTLSDVPNNANYSNEPRVCLAPWQALIVKKT